MRTGQQLCYGVDEEDTVPLLHQAYLAGFRGVGPIYTGGLAPLWAAEAPSLMNPCCSAPQLLPPSGSSPHPGQSSSPPPPDPKVITRALFQASLGVYVIALCSTYFDERLNNLYTPRLFHTITRMTQKCVQAFAILLHAACTASDGTRDVRVTLGHHYRDLQDLLRAAPASTPPTPSAKTAVVSSHTAMMGDGRPRAHGATCTPAPSSPPPACLDHELAAGGGGSGGFRGNASSASALLGWGRGTGATPPQDAWTVTDSEELMRNGGVAPLLGGLGLLDDEPAAVHALDGETAETLARITLMRRKLRIVPTAAAAAVGSASPEKSEMRYEALCHLQIHTLLTVVCWSAVDRVRRVAERLGAAEEKYWYRVANVIRAVILYCAWNPERQAFATYWGGFSVGPSILRLPELNFIPGTDPRFTSTLLAFEEDAALVSTVGDCQLTLRLLLELATKENTMHTATSAEFRQCAARGGSTFTTRTLLWYVEALRSNGRLTDARLLYEALLRRLNNNLLLTQSIDLRTGLLWGNIPDLPGIIGVMRCGLRLSMPWTQI